MGRVTHFEISASDPQAAADFYTNVFGWKITKWDGPIDYWLVSTGDPDSVGIDGGIFNPSGRLSGTVNSVEVEDIDLAVERVIQNGGQVAIEKNAIPGIGYQAYCQDIEGNIFGLHQPDPSAGM